ncbi:MAG: hypothetical protein NTZ27_03945 [Ignavibacteriales bacterium]|nr:hypothetical protein [Ignavibacteriales bacterium]
MSIGVKTRKMLWGRAANRCAFPDCKIELVMDETETDDESIIGDEAHIIAQQADGPRGNPNYPIDKIDKYGNLVLLCKIHHKLADDQYNTYSVDVLGNMKNEHEKWVKEKLSYDEQKQRDDEIYASYLESFNKLVNADNWNGWTSFIISSSSEMTKEHYNNLKELRNYLLNRVWPNRYTELEDAFLNFRLILNDFLLVFDKHMTTEKSDDWCVTERFYHIREYDKERYDMLLKKFNFHEALIDDFVCELTKACNYIYELVRKYLLKSYRIKEGVLLITQGPTIEGKDITYRLEYDEVERKTLPYKGLQDFMLLRESRSVYFGKGVSEDYSDSY